MTNADCIRRMNDEQLYDFLSEWECGDIDYSITFCDLCKQSGNELNLDCDGCRKHWLQSDAVDVGGLMYWKRNTTFEADTPQTESTGSPIGDYRDGVGAWQTDKLTEEEFDTMIAKGLLGQTDCDDRYAIRTDSGEVVAYACPLGCEHTDCGWGEPK